MIQGGDVNLINDEEVIDYTIPAEIKPNLFHRKGEIAAARMGDNVNPEKESSGCQFYIVQGKVYSVDELTLDINALYGGVRTLLQDEKYSDVREKFIAAQSNPAETQKLAISLRDDVEKLGIKKAEAEKNLYRLTEEKKVAMSIALINVADLKGTQAHKEAVATTDEDVISFINKIADAKELVASLTSKINAEEHRLRLFQTISANERREKGFYQKLGD